MERCPLCNGPAQAQGTRVVSHHNFTNVPRTTVRSFRCRDPKCSDEMGMPPSWRTSTEFIGWSSSIDHDPIALIGEKLLNTVATSPLQEQQG